MNEAIRNWLASGTSHLRIDDAGRTNNFYRMQRDEQIDLIFCQSVPKGNKLRTENLQYTAIYSKMGGQLYDSQIIGWDRYRSYQTDKDEFEKQVRQRISGIVNNSHYELTITDASQLQKADMKWKVENAWKDHNLHKVRGLFLDGKNPEDIPFIPLFSADQFTTDDYIEYIQDNGNVVERFSSRWFDENQEEMYAEFYVINAIKEELQRIRDDPHDPLHKIKSIMDAMANTDCKTVNVTTAIEGKELTFKTEASPLRRDCQSSYSSYNMPAQDKRRFEEAYGKYADYRPEDIVRITYGKKVLFDIQSAQQEPLPISESPEDAQGMSMSM